MTGKMARAVEPPAARCSYRSKERTLLSLAINRRAAVALATGIIVTATGCAAGNTGSEGTNTAAGMEDAQTLGHVHGLGIDPADGTLYIASHMGVFQLDEHSNLTRIADRYQDTMAFTIVGPGHFLASGHPDLREDLPPHLGLIESTDAAETWNPVSRQGESDFHALEVAGDQLYGYDSANESLLVTTDRRHWRVIDRTTLVDIAVDPDDSNRVLGATPQGGVIEYNAPQAGEKAEGQAAPVKRNAPPLVFLDWIEGDDVAGLALDGTTYRSPDGGRSWQRLSSVPGQAQALDAAPRAWHIATSTGVYRSTDEGRSWRRHVG